MAALIQADYEQLQQTARRFQSQSENIQKVSQQIENRIQRLTQSWTGVAATAFLAEMRTTVLPAIARLRTALAQAAQTTQKIGQTVNTAEEEAARLFVSQSVGKATSNGESGGGGGSGNGDSYNNSTLLYTGGAETILVQDGDGNSEPTAEGQEYIDATEQVTDAYPNVDPVLLGMIVRNEWNHRGYENAETISVVRLLAALSGGTPSFGVAQIQGGTAVEIISQHPELFTESDYSQLYIDGNLDQGRVEWELYVNKEFSLKVAALLVGEYGTQLESGFAAAGITITDTPQPGELSITPLQRDQLIAIMYNEGPGNVYNALADRSPEALIEYINTKIDAYETHITNVWSNQDHVETQVGTELGESGATPSPTPTMQA